MPLNMNTIGMGNSSGSSGSGGSGGFSDTSYTESLISDSRGFDMDSIAVSGPQSTYTGTFKYSRSGGDNILYPNYPSNFFEYNGEIYGVPLKYWLPCEINKQGKFEKWISWDEYNQWKLDTEDKRTLDVRSKTFYVYNAKEIEGIPELEIPAQNEEINPAPFIDDLIKNMGVGYHEGGNQAFVRATQGIIFSFSIFKTDRATSSLPVFSFPFHASAQNKRKKAIFARP